MKSDKWEESVFLSIGSNLGDRLYYLNAAIGELKRIGEIIEVSSVYETEAWGNSNLEPFLNQVIRLRSDQDPELFLAKCHAIERKLDRKRSHSKTYENRTIDIDILFWGNNILRTEKLRIPHPHIHKRAFVLVPLSEIAANFEHPYYQKRISTILTELSNIEMVEKFTG